MLYHFFIVIIIAIYSVAVQADKFAIVAGGGGHFYTPDHQKVMSDQIFIVDSQDFYMGLGNEWSKKYIFGYKDTNGFDQFNKHEKIKRDSEFTETTFLDNLDQIIKKAKEGDQVVLYITTHGIESGNSMGDVHSSCPDHDVKAPNHHSFTMGESDPEKKCNKQFALFRAKEKIKKLEALGVDVGIIMSSCYSADTFKDFKDVNACIIAGADATGGCNLLGSTAISSALLNYNKNKTIIGSETSKYIKDYKDKIIIDEDKDGQISLLEYFLASLKIDKFNHANTILGSDFNPNVRNPTYLGPDNIITAYNKVYKKHCSKDCIGDPRLNTGNYSQMEDLLHFRRKNTCKELDQLFIRFKNLSQRMVEYIESRDKIAILESSLSNKLNKLISKAAQISIKLPEGLIYFDEQKWQNNINPNILERFIKEDSLLKSDLVQIKDILNAINQAKLHKPKMTRDEYVRKVDPEFKIVMNTIRHNIFSLETMGDNIPENLRTCLKIKL